MKTNILVQGPPPITPHLPATTMAASHAVSYAYNFILGPHDSMQPEYLLAGLTIEPLARAGKLLRTFLPREMPELLASSLYRNTHDESFIIRKSDAVLSILMDAGGALLHSGPYVGTLHILIAALSCEATFEPLPAASALGLSNHVSKFRQDIKRVATELLDQIQATKPDGFDFDDLV